MILTEAARVLLCCFLIAFLCCSFSSKHSLVALTKTTPQELYDRKLDDKEFGEALSIAQTYNLDCDKVFQRQWKNAPISRASIQDYLVSYSITHSIYRKTSNLAPPCLFKKSP